MKLNVKKIGIAAAVVIVIGAGGFMVKNYISGKIESAQQSTTYKPLYLESSAEKMTLENSVRGAGIFTSFRIAKLEVPEGAKIVTRYVNDGDAIGANKNAFLINVNHENSYVKSPMDGLFFEQQNENTTTYSVYDTANSGVLVQISEDDAAKIAVNQKVMVHFNALNKDVEGMVSYISKIADNGMFSVKVSLPYGEDLRYGYNASVKIITSSIEDALVVPYEAVYNDGDKAYVVLAKHKKELEKTGKITEKMKTYVTTGASDNNNIQILEGLQVGDQVVNEENF